MNYINLTSEDYHFGGVFKEVDINEGTRIDAIIADLDEICSNEYFVTNSTRRRDFCERTFGLHSLRGTQFILLKTSEDILYSKSDAFQEVISWIQRSTHYWFEIRGVCHQGFKKEQQIERFTYFILFYQTHNNNIVFDDFQHIYCEKNYTINNSNNKYLNIIDYIFAKIEENLL